IVSPGSAAATCRSNTLRCFRFKRPLSKRSKVDILRFVMAYSSSLNSDPGSARLFQGAGPPPINASRQPKSCCQTGTRHQTYSDHSLPPGSCNDLTRPLRRFKFLVQYIAPEGTRLLSTKRAPVVGDNESFTLIWRRRAGLGKPTGDFAIPERGPLPAGLPLCARKCSLGANPT